MKRSCLFYTFVLLATSCYGQTTNTTLPVSSTTNDPDATTTAQLSTDVADTTTLSMTTTTEPVASSTVVPSSTNSTVQPPIVIDHSRTIGVLLGFSVAGVGIVSGILIYIWVKSRREEKSRYETLADKMMSRPSTTSLASNMPAREIATAAAAASLPTSSSGGFFTSRPATSSNIDYNIELPDSRRKEFVNRGFDQLDEEVASNTSGQAMDTVLDIGQVKFDSFHNKNGETSF